MNTFRQKLLPLVLLSLSLRLFASSASNLVFMEGCKAFGEGDWDGATYLLKQAVAYSENDNPETWYMLICAEVYSGDDRGALADCDAYLDAFAHSLYEPQVKYTKGKLLYNLGEYEKAVVVLSDFCHGNKDHPLYPNALYYIAESLYAGYKYSEAESIYKTIVTDFPDSEKTAAAQYRIESIGQHSREEKLLYLLKQTGEEYLAAKEDYEKQLRMYNADTANTAWERLTEAQARNVELENRVKELEEQVAALQKPEPAPEPEPDLTEMIRRLKTKAGIVQDFLGDEEK